MSHTNKVKTKLYSIKCTSLKYNTRTYFFRLVLFSKSVVLHWGEIPIDLPTDVICRVRYENDDECYLSHYSACYCNNYTEDGASPT